jgi:Phage Mu protein F like protein
MLFSPELQPYSSLFPAIRIAKRIDRRTLRALEALARRMEAPLREGFLAAIRSAKNNATLAVLEQAMRQLDPAAAIREATSGLEFNRMRDTLSDIVEASGVRTTNALKEITGQTLASFDITNPYAMIYARTSVGQLIREISDSTQRGIMNVIENAIENGVAPRQAAQQIRTMIGLTSQQTDWVINYQNSLYASGAIDIDAKVERYAAKVLRYRSLNIARTETINAVSSGQVSAWQAAIDQGLLPADVEQQWIVTDDNRLCPEVCPPMDGQKVPVVGGIFITGEGNRVKGPPAHVNCRCAISLVM